MNSLLSTVIALMIIQPLLYSQKSKKDTYSDTIFLKFKSIDIPSFGVQRGFYAIENDSQYNNLISESNNRTHSNHNFPKINFNKYVIMGFTGWGGGNKFIINTRVYRLKNSKKVITDMRITRDLLLVGRYRRIWIKVKRPHNGNYTFEFWVSEEIISDI